MKNTVHQISTLSPISTLLFLYESGYIILNLGFPESGFVDFPWGGERAGTGGDQGKIEMSPCLQEG